MSDELLYRLENRVAVLTLNRPERLNALTRDMMQALLARLSACAVDEAVGCVVVTGAGGAFCAGGDVRAQARVAAEGTAETPEHAPICCARRWRRRGCCTKCRSLRLRC